VSRFQRFTNDWPWCWRPIDLEEFTAQLRGERRALSTIRAHHDHLRLFLDYAADPRYEWTAVCGRLFGTHPSQVCFEWNTAVHVADYEGRPGRRALTKVELQALFDHADDEVARARARGRKGWLTAMRDATALKVRLTASPKHANLRLRGRITELILTAARGLAVGLTVTLPVVPLMIVIIGAENPEALLVAAAFWLLLGTAAGLAVGLLRFVSSDDAAQRSTSPTSSYRGDRARVVVELFGTGLALALLSGLSGALGGASGYVMLASALALGIVIGIARDAWPLFILASTWRALRR
jgi:hypothetical protein